MKNRKNWRYGKVEVMRKDFSGRDGLGQIWDIGGVPGNRLPDISGLQTPPFLF
jgi:hypothetical protein